MAGKPPVEEAHPPGMNGMIVKVVIEKQNPRAPAVRFIGYFAHFESMTEQQKSGVGSGNSAISITSPKECHLTLRSMLRNCEG